MTKDVMLLTGAGQICMVIAHRLGADKNYYRRQKSAQCAECRTDSD